MSDGTNPTIHAKVLQAAAGVCRKSGKSVPREATHVQVRRVAPSGQPAGKLIHTVVEATDGRAIVRLELPQLLARGFLIRASDVKRLDGSEEARFTSAPLHAGIIEPFMISDLPLPGGKTTRDFELPDLDAASNRADLEGYDSAFTVSVVEFATIASAFQRAGIKKVTLMLPTDDDQPIRFVGADRGIQGATMDAALLHEPLFEEDGEGEPDDVAGQQQLPLDEDATTPLDEELDGTSPDPFDES